MQKVPLKRFDSHSRYWHYCTIDIIANWRKMALISIRLEGSIGGLTMNNVYGERERERENW